MPYTPSLVNSVIIPHLAGTKLRNRSYDSSYDNGQRLSWYASGVRLYSFVRVSN